MPSRRYYTTILPVEHINGKMAPVATKCPNTYNSEEVEVSGFWYGYKHRATPNVSRFGIRTFCRDLNAKPYTDEERSNRKAFTASLNEVYAHKATAEDWALMLDDYRKQYNYATPIGYAVAACRSNGGVWPEDWIAP